MKLYIQIILVLLTQSVIAQLKPGESPLQAKIVTEDFKSTTKPKDKNKQTLSDFLETTPSEFLHIYANYEMDSAGVFTLKGSFRPIDSKFMDIYLIYEYTYIVGLGEFDSINNLMPKILSKKGDQLLKIKLRSYSTSKGKIKTRKIGKKYFQHSIIDGTLLIDIDKSQLTGSYLEINVLVKSRDFIFLTPSLTDGNYFSRYLRCSLPSFLLYSFPGANEGYKLVTTSESYFKILELDRKSMDWDLVAREINVIVNNKTWTINTNTNKIKPIEFTGFAPSFDIDMGFNLIDILR